MKNSTCSRVSIVILFLLTTASPLFAQKALSSQIEQSTLPLPAPAVINFTALAQQELLSPPPVPIQRNVEEDEEIHRGIPKSLPVPRDATLTKITIPENTLRTVSPSPTITFNGLLDNNQVIPPDVNGAVGITYLMETLNSQYRISNKSGAIISTLSLGTFWSGISGTPFSDPHIEYDPVNDRWITLIISTLTNNHYGIFIAVSQTNDPTGNWYEYSIDTGSSSTIPDYPLMGFNTNWVVITVNNFSNGAFFSNVKGFILNRSTIYSGSSGTVNTFTDASGTFTLSAAKTYDNTTTTEYLLSSYNGNSGGNGFVKLFSITGSVNSPVFAAINTIGVNQTWSSNEKDAPQSGSTKKITVNDDRMRDVIYRNGSLWACQTVFLPASSPNRASSQWWQINPSAQSVPQFGRVDDNTGATFYAFPSINVNNNGDVLMGYSVFSASIFASAGYSYRAFSDPANTMQDNYTFKSGQASYYKTYGGTRNRWGDYSTTCVDPVDGSIWTLQEFASTPANTWGTSWANVPPSNGTVPSCGVPGGLSATSITTSSATLSWSAVSGAVNYNVQFKPTSSSTWTSTSASTNSLPVSGLTASTQYEFQVQTACDTSSSSFSSSAFFTTGTTGCTDVYEANNTKATAKPISLNTNITALIGSSTDKDWFSFSNTSAQKNIQVSMTNVPADYDMQLFNPGGAKVKTSENGGTSNELINYNTSTVGTYKVKVYGYNGIFNTTQCYTLFVTISSTPFKLTDESTIPVANLTAYPNPTTGNITVEYNSSAGCMANLELIDITGKLVFSQQMEASEGLNSYHLDVSNVNPGVYVLVMRAGSDISRLKIMVER